MIEKKENEVTDCPCSRFESIRSIAQALETKEQTQTLISWLSGEEGDNRSLSCGSRCSKRISASLSVLNAIRDACRPYLESSSVKKEKSIDPVVYEEAFPALAASNAPSKEATVLVGRKKSKAKTENKSKRRIRPAVLSPVPPSAWGKPAGNLVHLPSEEPLALNTKLRDITKNTKVASAALTPCKSMPTSFVTPKKENFVTPSKQTENKGISTTNEKKEDIASLPQMTNLIDTYIALIESALVPSTVLELHLLIRLLSVSCNKSPSVAPNKDGAAFAPIFAKSTRCTCFASQALLRLSYVLRSMGATLWKELVRCPPFRLHLPALTQEFESLLETNVARTDSIDITAGSHTALLTLPFNEQRDSRHNYKTREEQALYKNREESRDAFLYQLRAFLSIRGKLVDAVQAEKSLQKIRQSSRIVVDGLMDANLPWFSEFFCDLLLQIGLVPLQETDKDILRIADKDKLQKLHKRFSSKVGTATKSTKKLVADKRDSKLSSPTTEAQQFFPGHQEFFFLFLMSADSYAFNIHLRSRLISELNKLASNLSMKDFERRMLDMRLIARFVGLLFFYSNWRAGGSLLQGELFSASLDGMHQLAASGLPILSIIEKAWKDGHDFVAVVPWVVELLRMTTWDPHSRRSKLYEDVLGFLRQTQLSLSGRSCKCRIASPCTEFVLLCTETLFDEVVGLVRAALLPALLLPDRTQDSDGERDEFLDLSGTCFSTTLLYAASPHVEELTGLLSSLSRVDPASLRSPGASRKLRPSIISPTTDSLSIRPADKSRSPKSGPGVDRPTTASAAAGNLHTTEFDQVKAKLRDRFFHQHRDLKEVCEIVVNRLLKNVATELPTKCIRPILDSCLVSDSKELLTVERKAIAECQSFVKATLESDVEQALALLSPFTLNRQIIATASCLAISHGEELGKTMVEGLVRAELRLRKVALDRDERKRLFAKEAESDVSAEVAVTVEQRQHFMTVVDAMDCCRECFSRLEGAQAESILNAFDTLLVPLEAWCPQSVAQLPPEDDLRSLFQSILLLDRHSYSLLEWASDSNRIPVVEGWAIMSKYLKVTILLARFSRHGLSNVKAFLANSLDRVVYLGVTADQTRALLLLLVDLYEARMIKTAGLREALRHESSGRQSERGDDSLVKDCIAVLKEQTSLEVSALRRMIGSTLCSDNPSNSSTS